MTTMTRPGWLRAAICALALSTLAIPLSTVGGCAGTSRDVMEGAAPGESEMRIRIARDQTEGSFDAVSKFDVFSARGSYRRATLQGPLRVRLSEAGWVVTDGSGTERGFDRAEPLVFRPLGATTVKYNDAEYPGQIRLHSHGGGASSTFDVVEHIPMEQYLPGVISKELVANWSQPAFEAQAIAARSYALHEKQRHMARGEVYDVESTDRDQVYGGRTTNPTAVAAVLATKGQVLTYQGHLLRAYYSSTCGGQVGSARDVWPTNRGFEFNLAAPLQGGEREHACQFSPLYQWTVTRDVSDLLRRIKGWGTDQQLAIRGLTSIKRIDTTKRSATGRPTEFRVYQDDGKHWTINAEHLRAAMNYGDGANIPTITRDQRIHSSNFEVAMSGGRITFKGKGFGHGVGMCQFCLEGFARRGESVESMLVRFYPGAQIERLY